MNNLTMLSRQHGLRLVKFSYHRSHVPSLQRTLQRRFLSLEEPPLTGAADNAFNRERRAVKAHAAATSGISSINKVIAMLQGS